MENNGKLLVEAKALAKITFGFGPSFGTSPAITMEIVLNEKVLFIISVYCPQSGRNEEDNQFYNELSQEIIARNGRCIIMEYFNEHVESSVDGFEGVYGGYGWVNKSCHGGYSCDQ